jgi:putative hemolysin
MSEILLELVIIAVLLVLNGIFSMSELAIVASKRVRLERHAERGDPGARAALALAANPSDFLSTVQVGITLVGVIASVYGGATIAEQLAIPLATVPWLTNHAEAAALVIVVAGITYLSVIIGELVPKRIALGNPERVAALVARPMKIVSRVGSPLVRLLTGSTQLILRLFGVRGMPEPGLTEEEIHAVIEQGAETGVVPEVEHEIVENVFRLGDRHVSAVMTPRPDIEWIDATATPADIRAAIGVSARDWLLVCDGEIERVLGLVRTGDLLVQCLDGKAINLSEVLREPLYVPMTTPVFQLLGLFREKRRDVAVVLDEYGAIEGVASMANIADGLVGAPSSDASERAPSIVENKDGTWTADGDVEIADVEAVLDLPGLDLAPRRNYRTLAGFILARLGSIPSVGQSVDAHGWRFEVGAMDGRRIERIEIALSRGSRR